MRLMCKGEKKKRSKERYTQNYLELLNCGATPPRERERIREVEMNTHKKKGERGKECKGESK